MRMGIPLTACLLMAVPAPARAADRPATGAKVASGRARERTVLIRLGSAEKTRVHFSPRSTPALDELVRKHGGDLRQLPTAHASDLATVRTEPPLAYQARGHLLPKLEAAAGPGAVLVPVDALLRARPSKKGFGPRTLVDLESRRIDVQARALLTLAERLEAGGDGVPRDGEGVNRMADDVVQLASEFESLY